MFNVVFKNVGLLSYSVNSTVTEEFALDQHNIKDMYVFRFLLKYVLSTKKSAKQQFVSYNLHYNEPSSIMVSLNF